MANTITMLATSIWELPGSMRATVQPLVKGTCDTEAMPQDFKRSMTEDSPLSLKRYKRSNSRFHTQPKVHGRRARQTLTTLLKAQLSKWRQSREMHLVRRWMPRETPLISCKGIKDKINAKVWEPYPAYTERIQRTTSL
ncbi:hypothetical protein ACLOJK_036877 [Asimina triloba]